MRAGLFVICAASTAAAAPLAQIDFDVDGDGVADHVSFEGGTLIVATKQTTQRVVLGAATVARVSAATVKIEGKPVHAVVAAFGDRRSETTAVFSFDGASLKQIVREKTGSAGTDGEYDVAIAAVADVGVLRYQTRPGIRRCDGKPTYLFAEGWTGKKFQRLARVPTDVPDSAPVLTAHADAAPALTPLVFQARTTSHQPGTNDASELAIPTALDDGDPATFWRESFAKSAGEGQFFTFESRVTGAKAAQVRVLAGNHASKQQLRTMNRPRRLGIASAKGAWHVELPDAATQAPGTPLVVDLPPEAGDCVTVVIESTYGNDDGETAISELEVFAEGERNGGGEAALAKAIADGVDVHSATQALARRQAQGVTAIEAQLAATKDRAARTRLAMALTEIRVPAIGPPLVRLIGEGLFAPTEILAPLTALARQHLVAELEQLIGDGNLAESSRKWAASALATTIQPSDALAVAKLSDPAPREVRGAVIGALATLPAAVLLDTAKQAETLAPPIAGDVWRAITRRARSNEAERAPALAAMLAAFPTATDYERRYRLVDGLAELGDAAALQTLAAMLAKLPAGAERAAYEQVAANAIAATPRPEALELLTTLVREPDPGVRYAALTALGTVESGVAGPWHAAANSDAIDRVIQTSLASDTWPEVRARAAQMLGARCSRIGPAKSLADAVVRDPTLTVRGDALTALVECKASGAAALLAKVWDADKQPIELRQRAIDLTVALGDKQVATALVKKLAQWRGAALESEAALALAQNAAYAIGRLAPPGAADALLAALDDSAYPEIVAAAASGLGLMRAGCPAAAKAKLRVLAHSEEQQIQLAAAHAALECGGN